MGYDGLHAIQKWALAELMDIDDKIENAQGTHGDRRLQKRRAKLWQIAYHPTARQKVHGIRGGFLNKREAELEGVQSCVDRVRTLLDDAKEDLRDRRVYSAGGYDADQR